MYKNKELRLRVLISLVFVFVVLAPLFLIVADLTNIAKRLWQQQLDVSRQELKEEMVAFRESLIKAGEPHLGLVAETRQQPVFARSQEAGLFTSAAISLLRGRARVNFIERVEIKGKSREYPLYELTALRQI